MWYFYILNGDYLNEKINHCYAVTGMFGCVVALHIPVSVEKSEFWIRTLAASLIQYVCGRPQKCLLINGVT